MQHSAPSPAPANAAPRDRIQMFLLACGIIAPLIYAGSDLVAGSRWQGYSFTDQTISELNAIGSPTRAITVVMGLAGYVLLIAFGTGVWRSARGDRRLRTLGGLLLAFGALALWAVPFASMNARGVARDFNDTRHLLGGGISLAMLIVAIGTAASAFGARYRAYSFATLLTLLVFGIWSGTDSARMIQDLPTPWMGLRERVSVYSYQLWLVVLAVMLLRRPTASKPGRAGKGADPANRP